MIAVDTQMGGIYPSLMGYEDRLYYSGGISCFAGVNPTVSVGLWCLISLPLECVACGNKCMVLDVVTGCIGPEAFKEVPIKISYYLCPAWDQPA